MGFKLLASREDVIEFVSSLDVAVDSDSEEGRKAYLNYLKTLDRSGLVLKGKPTVFRLRPLDWTTYELACRDARGTALRGIYTDLPTARELLRLSVEDVVPWPSEWGKEDDAFLYEYRRKVFAPKFIGKIPPGTCREAAKVLLDSMPIEPDEPEKNDEENPDAVPFGKGSAVESGSSSGPTAGRMSSRPIARSANAGSAKSQKR